MKRYFRKKEAVSGNLHNEMVMMDLDQGKYFSLNPVATRIWELLEDAKTLKELCNILQEEFDVEEQQCMKEVREHLEEMIRLKLVFAKEEK
ncbi:PqqD family protein [Maribellus mangrovi]|uniref:PqqD family protein n=1 Tax=Maribellus mangrovi TaxID=3133146 RepID=UPI0030ED83C1